MPTTENTSIEVGNSAAGAGPCYLCGLPLDGELSQDHVLPKQFIKRKQPRMRGFAYAGKLQTHQKCNNEFADERYCQHALRLLELFWLDRDVLRFQYSRDPRIKFVALTPDMLPGAGPAELEYFGLSDVRGNSIEEFKNYQFFEGKPKVNPIKKPLNNSLSVITKSACAFLLSNGKISLPSHWRILLVPLMDPERRMDMPEFFANRKPYEEGIQVWDGPTERGDGAVVFRAGSLIVFVLVTTSRCRIFWNKVSELGREGNRFMFNGARLTELVGYDWTRRAF